MSAILCFSESSRGKAITLILLFALSTGLSVHYAHIVHGSDWIGVERSVDDKKVLIEGTREWHTRLTGLYRRQPTTPPPD
jgi:hypothetical protein